MEPAAKILIVEDNREMRELVAKALKKEGHRVSMAGDGKEMVRALDDETSLPTTTQTGRAVVQNHCNTDTSIQGQPLGVRIECRVLRIVVQTEFC